MRLGFRGVFIHRGEFTLIGKMIGDYQILEKRGEGGMGMFFRARDIRLDRIVGLKMIRAELLHDPEILAKLEEEARSLARLDHPNIARLLHYIVSESQRCIVMEYVEGSDLAEKLRRDGPFSLDSMAVLVPQVCAAISYAHNRNVIHRDIKPSNMLLTRDKTVKVTDFGIAKILGVSAKTKTGVATGSLPYMAPEQIRGKQIDARTDIYQLGVMVFELLVGRRPFLAETEYDMMSHHLSTPPPVPSALRPGIPKSIDRVLIKALAKNPEERFATVDEFLTEFRDALPASVDSRTVFRVNADADAGAWPPVRRRYRLAGAIAVAILAVLAFVKVFVMEGAKEKTAPTYATQSLRIVLDAPLPAGIEPAQIGGHELKVIHPELGTILMDSLRLVGVRFEGTFSVAQTDSIGISLTAYNAAHDSLAHAAQWLACSGLTSATVTLALWSVVPGYVVGNNTVNADRPLGQESIQGEEPHAFPNLTLDAHPFAVRERIDAIWINGSRQMDRLPLELELPQGLHRILWQIDTDFWTDTVTVGEFPVQKNLMYDKGHGRINVAVIFPDGPGYAEIILDGQETGQGTPGELRDVAAGPHEITLIRDGYGMPDGPVIVRVAADDRTRVSIPMVRR